MSLVRLRAGELMHTADSRSNYSCGRTRCHSDLITPCFAPLSDSGRFFGSLITSIIVTVTPFGHRPCPVFPPFVLIYAMMMSVVTVITAYLFVIQFRSRREPLLGALAGAFGYVSVLVFSQILVFPGVLAPTGLFNEWVDGQTRPMPKKVHSIRTVMASESDGSEMCGENHRGRRLR